tara:strand:- start:373 stop:480 length:108 start_codon:yes stop_codon:yes gene_type:complete
MIAMLTIFFIGLCLVGIWTIESKDLNSDWGDEDES